MYDQGMTRVIGYARVSTDEQVSRGHGLAAQRRAIEEECDRRGWELVEIVGEERGASAKSLDRAGLRRALAQMDAGEAEVLLVAKMDRLSRSLVQGAAVMEQAKRYRWSLVAIDLGIDMSTPSGELLANMLLSAAQFERRLIGERTKVALASARAKGIVLGRKQSLPDEIVGRILTERSAGRSLTTIAAGLAADGVTTAQGGATWHPSTVAAVLKSQAAQRIRANG